MQCDGKVLFAICQVRNLTILFVLPKVPSLEGKMRRGQRVEVVEAFDGKQVKAVVDWNENFVFVCRLEEYDAAQSESREPNSIGFQREFVREVVERKS